MKRSGRLVVKALDCLVEICAHIGMVLIVFLSFFVAFGALSRFFFNKPIAGTIELTEFSLLMITFFSAAWIFKQDGHISIDIVTDFLNKKWKKILSIMSLAMAFVTFSILFFFGFSTTYNLYKAGRIMAGSIELPRYIIISFIPIGLGLLIFQVVRQLYKKVKDDHKDNSINITGA